jgi:hypothetical protein
MAGEIQQRAVVDHEPVRILADDGGLHTVVKDFPGNAADRLQRGDMAAQDTLQILMKTRTVLRSMPSDGGGG